MIEKYFPLFLIIKWRETFLLVPSQLVNIVNLKVPRGGWKDCAVVRGLAALTEDPVLVSSTHMPTHREGGPKSKEQESNDRSHWRQVQGWLFVDNPIKRPNPAPEVGNFKDFMTIKELTCQEENHCAWTICTTALSKLTQLPELCFSCSEQRAVPPSGGELVSVFSASTATEFADQLGFLITRRIHVLIYSVTNGEQSLQRWTSHALALYAPCPLSCFPTVETHAWNKG